MSKSGLHKQIASIFDGVPIPDNPSARSGSVLRRMMDDEPSGTASAQKPQAQPEPAPANASQPQPDRNRTRPRPVAKSRTTTQSTVLKAIAQSPGKSSKRRSQTPSFDQRQKKMLILVGILSVVFVVTLRFSIGGIGHATAKTNLIDEIQEAELALPKATPIDPESWVLPEPLPATMRDPLVIPTARITQTETIPNDVEPIETTVDLSVRGIVYSQEKPSAIVNDQVVSIGQTVHGVRIVNITHHSVEFEKGGTRWTQGVRQAPERQPDNTEQ